MANNDDKDILITPNVGQSGLPNIQFKGFNADTDGDKITLNVLNDNTLSFESNQGQVFSINPILNTGDIFSVNDISGIQSMAVNADGNITMNAQTQSVTIKNSASNTATLILENTNTDAIDGPILDLYRNDGANSGDGDDIGAIVWSANNDAGQKTNFGRIMMEPNDVSNGSEDGEMIFKLMEGGSDEQEYFRLRGGVRQIEFNTGKDDIDVTINTDNIDNMFYSNAGLDKIGIGGVTTPEAVLDIRQHNATNAFGLVIGADVSANSLTDNTRKFTRIGMHHYDNDEEHVNLIVGDSDNGANKVSFGGGTNQGNAATLLNFYAAADATTVTGTIQANITSSGLQIGSGARVTTISTSFSDNNTSLMTSAAINDRIESFGYTTNTGDITGVDLTVTSPITIASETNTTSGSYSATLGLDDPDNLTELTESTDATDDKILLWDESASSWKYMTLDNLQDSIDTTGGGGGVSLTGSTNDQLVTVTGSNAIQGESNLTLSSGGVLALSGNMTIVDSHSSTPALVVEQDSTTGSAVIQQWKTQANELTEIRNNGNIFFHLSTAGGGANESILSYKDTAGTERNMLMLDTGTVCLLNRGPNGDVEIRANNATAGTSGESVIISATSSGMQLGGANARVTTILDEDNMSSNSATALATQQSIKAYVDANSGGGSTTASVKPVVYMDTGTQNVSQTEATVGFNSEVMDPDGNASMTTDGHIRLAAAGIYRISYSIPINDDGSTQQDRTRVFGFMQVDDNNSFSSPTTVAQSRAQVYTREASGGSGISTSFLYEHTANDYIRIRIDAQNTTDISTESGQAQISIALVSGVGSKAPIISVSSGTTTLTNAQSGSVVYLTSSGAVNLPSSIEAGVQFVIINDTGGNETPGLNGNTHVLGTHGAMSSNTARTYVAVSSGNVAAIG